LTYETLEFICILILVSLEIYSQIISEGPSAQFLLSSFSGGKIKMRNGEVHDLLMNYNTLSEKLVYKQNERFYDLINQNLTDTIYFQDSKFISSAGVLYQVLTNTKVPFFVHYKGKLLPPGTPAGYGENSQVSNTKLQSSFSTSSGNYNLDLPADYKVRIDLIYYFRKNDMLVSFSNQRELLKVIPDKAEELKQFIKKNKIKFDNPTDIGNLAQYYNKLN
jgi:hypothetical protein